MAGVFPYQAEEVSSTVFLAMNKGILPGDLSRLPELSFVARKLISKCWNLEPGVRPTIEQCAQRLAAYFTPSSTNGNAVSTPTDDTELTMASLPMNLIRIPAELKTGGEDWYAVFNPHAPRKLDITLVSSFPHEG